MAFGKHIKKTKRKVKDCSYRKLGLHWNWIVLLSVKSKMKKDHCQENTSKKLAEFLNTPIDELLVLWFSDKIKGLIDDKRNRKTGFKNCFKRIKCNQE